MKNIFAVLVLMLGISTVVGARESFSFGVGSSNYYAPNYGHYENRQETILVVPAHFEKVIVQPASTETKIVDGKKIEVINYEKYEERYCPARYETRLVTVWVADRYYSYYSPYYFGFSYSNSYRSYRR